MTEFEPSAVQRATSAMQHDRWTVSVLLSSELTIDWISESCRPYLGHDPLDVVGNIATDFLHPDDVMTVAQMLADTATDRIVPGIVERPILTLSVEFRLRHADGEWRTFESLVTNHLADSSIAGYFVLLRDVSHRHRLDTVLEKIGVGRPLPEILTSVAELVAVSMRQPNTALVILRPQQAESLRSFGTTDDQIPDDVVNAEFWRRLDVEPTSIVAATHGETFDWRPRHLEDSNTFWGFAIKSPTTDLVVGVAAIWSLHNDAPLLYETRAITTASQLAGVAIEREFHADSLRFAATHDGLTGATNRVGFRARLDDFGADPTQSWALVTVDLDGFKVINDTNGHYAGDFVLTEVARRITAIVRANDTVARMGGDEFAVLCTSVGNRAAAEAIGQRIIDAVRSITHVNRIAIDLGASVGIAMGTVDDDPHRLLTRSDVAMYEAKRAGKGRFVVVEHDQRPRRVGLHF